MEAWLLDDSPVPRLQQEEVALPERRPGELLIRVHAAGVTPTELVWYPTTHDPSGDARRHAIPGHEFSGVVVAAEPGCGFAVGDEVFGMNDWFAEGATAEFCCTLPSMVVPKPASLTHVEAASVPIGALTAWQGLFDRARLCAGERVLIHGGSGAVGVFAIQFARQCRAEILTTASTSNRDFLHRLGANRVIAYRNERFEDLVGKVDVVFDAVGGATLARSWAVLGERGRMVTIAADSEATTDERVKQAFFIVRRDRPQLEEIARQLVGGTLVPVVESVVSFDEAGAAYEPSPTRQRGCGKTVVRVSTSGFPA